MIIKDRIITLDDVKLLNNSANSQVILHNTVGQNADIIEKLNKEVQICVIGGYDFDKDKKYSQQKYVERTFYKSEDLAEVIRNFEVMESKINQNWSSLEKALFVYCYLCNNIKYDYQEISKMQDRNLLSIVTKLSRCAGYAICFTEAMDRLGIECEFKNVSGIHSWDALKLHDKWLVVDVTWASNLLERTSNSMQYLKYFGQIPSLANEITHKDLTDKKEFAKLSKIAVWQAYFVINKDKSSSKELNLENNRQF